MAAGPNDLAGVDPDALRVLRRAGLERQDLAQRLARFEFQSLRRELSSASVFDLQVDVATRKADPVPEQAEPEMSMPAELLAGLPQLPVPLGRIAWTKRPEDLQVAGILIDVAGDDAALSSALLSLLTEHHRNPFARIVFLCRTLDPVHVLGRYGFLCHQVGRADPASIGALMQRRYGIQQIRSLDSGRKLWSALD